MAEDPITRLGAHHAAGVAILNNELKRAQDDASEAASIEHEIAWTADLEAVAQPFGAAFVWQLVPYVGEMEPDELGLIEEYLEDESGRVEIEPRSVEHAMSLATLATRLHRIKVKRKELDAGLVSADAPPTKKSRGRPPRDKSWKVRADEWAVDVLILRKGRWVLDEKKAGEIAEHERIQKKSVKRAVRAVRQKKEKAENEAILLRLGMGQVSDKPAK